MTALVTENMAMMAGAPDGVSAIRSLVFELAVSGSLLQQSEFDERADELLIRVDKAKRQLGIKPAKPSTGRVASRALPRGWVDTTFEAIALEVSTGPFGSLIHQSDYVRGGVPLVNPSHMINGRIVADPDVALAPEMAATLGAYRLAAGDLVMARRGEVGRVALVTAGEDGWLCGTGSFRLRFTEEMSRDYLRLLFWCPSSRRYLAGAAVGMTMVNLNHGVLSRMPIALPPLAEQHRIVAKVDELMALCDRLDARQQDAEAAHARLVQALLDSLTQARDADEFQACWRRLSGQFEFLFTTDESVDCLLRNCIQWALAGRFATHVPSDEPAMTFVSRAALARDEAMGSRARNRAAVNPQSALISRVVPGMPENWCRCRVDEITECLDYLRRPINKVEREGRSGSIPYYGANGQVGWIDEHLFDEELVLVVEDETFIGRTKPFSYAIQGRSWVNNHAHVLRPLAGMSAQYLNLCLHRYDFIPLTSGTTGRRKLTQAGLNAAEITIAPLAEQSRIVAKVDELIALCDQLKACIAAARAKHAQLAEALVGAAVA